MKRDLSRIAFVLTMAFLCGCATTMQTAPMPNQQVRIENEGQARIYLVRPAATGGAIQMDVFDDEKLIGSTGPTSYLCWEREPGKAIIASKSENRSALELDVEAGEVYYIWQHVRPGVVYARVKLELITEEEGLKKLKKCKPEKQDQ